VEFVSERFFTAITPPVMTMNYLSKAEMELGKSSPAAYALLLKLHQERLTVNHLQNLGFPLR